MSHLTVEIAGVSPDAPGGALPVSGTVTADSTSVATVTDGGGKKWQEILAGFLTGATPTAVTTTVGLPVDLVTGLTAFSNTALSSTKTAVKASPGKLYGWMVHNPSAATAYIQVWNVAIGSITVGTTAPTYTIQLPTLASANVMSERGITHSVEINIAATTTPTGSSAPATALVVSLFYI